jgi:hypothetical protein
MSYFRILSGQTTNEGMFHYREDRYRIHEERDCKRCEDYRDWLFAHSPVVRFMRDEVRKLGGDLDGSNVVCKRCPARLTEDGNVVRQSGGFSPHHGILICANEVRNRGHLEDTLSHEMVHAWDNLRWKVDFVGEKDLRQAACTEVSFFLRLDGYDVFGRMTNMGYMTPDSGINAQRRVQVVERVDHARQLEPDAAVPELRAEEGGPVCHGAAEVQGRHARRQGG